MMQTVKGVYRNGRVELLEPPSSIFEGEVFVTFVKENTVSVATSETTSETTDAAPRRMYRGMLASHAQHSTEEDFKVAEFYGDSDDGLSLTKLL